MSSIPLPATHLGNYKLRGSIGYKKKRFMKHRHARTGENRREVFGARRGDLEEECLICVVLPCVLLGHVSI